MDIVAAARAHLLTNSQLLALLGSGSGFAHWIFVGADDLAMPFVQIEGSQKACVLLRQQGDWASPNPHNSMTFPLLVVEIFVDPLRDSVGNIVSPDLKGRFEPIQKEIVKMLHRPQGDVQTWGTVRTLGSQQIDSWSYFTLSETDGTGVARSGFGLSLG